MKIKNTNLVVIMKITEVIVGMTGMTIVVKNKGND